MRTRARTAFLVAAGLLAAHVSHATTYSWLNAAGGAATTTSNWSPAGYPHAGDGSIYGLGSAYMINWASPVDTLLNVQVVNGSPTFAIANRLGVGSFVGVDNGATMTLNGGTIWAPQLRVNDVTSGNLIATGATSEIDVADVEHGCTGCPGPGYGSGLEVQDGARLICRGPVHVCADPAALEFGILEVHGRARLAPPYHGFASATLMTLAGGTPDCIVGGSLGWGQLSVYDGGYMNVAGRLLVGMQATGTGSVSCAAAGAPGALVVQGETFVGANTSAGARGGHGGLGIEDSYANFVGRMWLGDPDDPTDGSVYGSFGVGGTANVIISGGITMSAGLTGDFAIGGGITQVIGGPSTLRQYFYPTIGGQLWLENGTTTDLWSNPGYDPRAVMIGAYDAGLLRVVGAGTTLNVHGDTQIGDVTTAGAMEVDSSGTTHFMGALVVEGGPNSDATMTVNGSGSVATVQDSLVVASGTGYFGQALVESLGTMTVSGPIDLGNGGYGQVTVNGGTLTGAGATSLGSGGEGRLYAIGSGHATLAGATIGPVFGYLEAGPGGHIDVTDHLDVLPSGGLVSADSAGVITYAGGSHALNVAASTAGYGELLVNAGGSLQASPEIDVRGLMALSVTTGIWNAAPNRARSRASLRPAKPARVTAPAQTQTAFSGVPALAQCGLTRVLGSGTLQGLGVVKGRLHLDAGTTALLVQGDDPSVTGRLTAGDSTKTDGFVSIGQTAIANGDTLTPLDSDGADLGKVTMAGGVLQLLKPGHLKSGFRLDGNGTIAGSLDVRDSAWVSFHGQVSGDVALAGTLDLGSTASLLLVGSFHPSATGRTTLKVGHINQDVVVATGPVVLGGTMDVRSILGDTPVVGDTFTVLAGSSVTGTFADVTLNGHPGAGKVAVLYRAGDVRIAIVGAVTGVDDTPPIAASAPGELRFAAMGGPRDAALALDLPTTASVRVALYDVTGRQVATLADGELGAGRHRFELARTAPASGMYFARAVVSGTDGARSLTTRVVVLR